MLVPGGGSQHWPIGHDSRRAFHGIRVHDPFIQDPILAFVAVAPLRRRSQWPSAVLGAPSLCSSIHESVMGSLVWGIDRPIERQQRRLRQTCCHSKGIRFGQLGIHRCSWAAAAQQQLWWDSLAARQQPFFCVCLLLKAAPLKPFEAALRLCCPLNICTVAWALIDCTQLIMFWCQWLWFDPLHSFCWLGTFITLPKRVCYSELHCNDILAPKSYCGSSKQQQQRWWQAAAG